MTLDQQTAFFADLRARGPFGQIKIEVNEQGWYFLYVWTGEQVLWYIGSTLPAALQCVAGDLWHRYGKEI